MPDALIAWGLEHGGPFGISIVVIAFVLTGSRLLSPILDRIIGRRKDGDSAESQQLADRRQLSADTKMFQNRLMLRLEQAEERAIKCEIDRIEDQTRIRKLEDRIDDLERELQRYKNLAPEI